MGRKWVRRSKNPLRAQSKYGLMGSSAKTGKKIFESHRSTFWIKMPFGIGHPPTHQLQSTCVGEDSRVPNLQTEFNYLDSFKSYGIFSDFVVPTWSPSSSHRPRHPHIIPTSSLSSPSSSCCPHSLQKVPMWSPWSVVSTCCPRHPHRSRHPHVVPIALRRSPCGLHGLWSPHVVPVVPVIPTSSPSSSHCLEGPHIIPNPPGTHSTHPPPPWGGGGPKSVKMQ